MGEWLGFSATLIVLIIVTWSAHRWWVRSRDHDDPAAVDRDMLTAIRDLQREGDLSDEEYRSIKSQLVGRIAEQEELQRSAELPKDAPDSGGSAGSGSPAREEFRE